VAKKLEKSDISMLVSLVALEIERCDDPKNDAPSYEERLLMIRDKLLEMLTKPANQSNSSNGDLPEFREYARNKYGAELDEDLITMFEDLINMRRKRIR